MRISPRLFLRLPAARRRDDEGEEGMEDWDQDELERVVKEKHGAEKPGNTTNIICKVGGGALPPARALGAWGVAVRGVDGTASPWRSALSPNSH